MTVASHSVSPPVPPPRAPPPHPWLLNCLFTLRGTVVSVADGGRFGFIRDDGMLCASTGKEGFFFVPSGMVPHGGPLPPGGRAVQRVSIPQGQLLIGNSERSGLSPLAEYSQDDDPLL